MRVLRRVSCFSVLFFVCVLFCGLSFCPFYFLRCIVCPSLIYSSNYHSLVSSNFFLHSLWYFWKIFHSKLEILKIICTGVFHIFVKSVKYHIVFLHNVLFSSNLMTLIIHVISRDTWGKKTQHRTYWSSRKKCSITFYEILHRYTYI